MRKIVLSVTLLALLTTVAAYLAPNYAVLELERLGGGEAVNPTYSLQLTGGGQVIFNGKRTYLKGEKKAKISSQQARKLVTDFIRLNPLKYKNTYQVQNGAPTVRLTFRLFFYKKAITFDEITAPTEITEFGDKIDKAAKSDQWVFSPDQY